MGGVEHSKITAHVFDHLLLIISTTFCLTLKQATSGGGLFESQALISKFNFLIPSCPPRSPQVNGAKDNGTPSFCFRAADLFC
jgi:hypothetical protein